MYKIEKADEDIKSEPEPFTDDDLDSRNLAANEEIFNIVPYKNKSKVLDFHF